MEGGHPMRHTTDQARASASTISPSQITSFDTLHAMRFFPILHILLRSEPFFNLINVSHQRVVSKDVV
jgi:hypothetical protein